MLFISYDCHALASVHCCLVVTCWERADLLFVMFNCVFVTFPCGILGKVWYLIVSIPDPCCLSYFEMIHCIYKGVMPEFLLVDLRYFFIRFRVRGRKRI